MSYATLAELKTYLGIPTAETAHDTLLTTQLAAATAAIDAECSRSFVGTVATRRFGAESVMGQLLHLSADVLAVTSVANGDGAVMAADSYRLWPRNVSPAWALFARHPAEWIARDDDDTEIVVSGTWGYSVTPPAQVVQATLRLAGFMYQQKDAQLGVAQLGVRGGRGFGSMLVSPELLADVQSLLRGLRRRSS